MPTEKEGMKGFEEFFSCGVCVAKGTSWGKALIGVEMILGDRVGNVPAVGSGKGA